MTRVLAFLLLPNAISAFERSYLARMNRVGLLFFALHVPALTLLAWLNHTGPAWAAALSLAVLAGPAVAFRSLESPRSVSVIYGVTAMFMGGLLVHFGQGPVQIEMHFYFFALLAMLAVYANPLVIVAATVTVALHHLALWFLLPASVFNYAAPLWVVLVHAAFVVLEATATCFIARSFFDNVIGLEKIVQKRTAELDARTAEMRLVLDNVEQGFVTLDRAGVMSQERSASFDRWFGEPAAGSNLFTHLGAQHPQFAGLSQVGFDQLIEGLLPTDLSLAQMPEELVQGDRVWRFAYQPIGGDAEPERFLLVVTDVTAERARKRAEQERKETLHVLERMLADRSAFGSFFDEGTELVQAISSGDTSDLPTLKRRIHTLKGNAGIFGLETVAEICHELETQLLESDGRMSDGEVAKLTRRWRALADDVEQLGGRRHGVIEVEEREHREIVDAVLKNQPRQAVLQRLLDLTLEPVRARFDHAADQARRIASRLGKPTPEVVCTDNGLRLDPKRWGRFWSSFVHLVRNAVDHGVEPEDERRERGKPAEGLLAIEATVSNASFTVAIRDDGRGIDWERVAKKARARGLELGDPDALSRALFADGVSTAEEVSDISGRGVGMGAVLAATEQLGGRVEISSEVGQGTELRLVFPRSAMAPQLESVLGRAA